MEWRPAPLHAPAEAPERADPVAVVHEAVRAVLSGRSVSGRPRSDPDEEIFIAKLFSVRHAEGLARGTRVLTVGPGTVVTPLARDLLKRQGIAIRVGSPGETASGRGEWAFAVETDGGVVQALRRSLLEDQQPWIEHEPCLERLSSWLIREMGRGAMWVTERGALTVWKACQRPGVRAASAGEPSEVRRAVDDLGMNLLVVEAAGKSISWMRQLAAALRASGAPRLPAFLSEGGHR